MAISGVLDIPSFSFLIVLPYLDSQDALSLRRVSSRSKELIDEDSELLWAHFLVVDFGLDDATRTLRVEPWDRGPSIFGTSGRNSVVSQASPFECWKQWKRANERFWGASGNSRNINASFFLRAAVFWETMEHWCMRHGSFGRNIMLTLRDGETSYEWPPHFQNLAGLDAIQAVYAFYSGQDDDNTLPRYGLLGGWSAYSLVRMSMLSRPGRKSTHVTLATCCPKDGTSYALDPLTGNISHPLRNPCPPLGFESVLCWLEEYCRRLKQGEYQVGSLGQQFGSIQVISHYPQLPPHTSRAVTRGVEVVASSIWSPSDSIFAYSIRIRLLVPTDDEYDTNRGFETCQLKTRHWRLTRGGRPDNVDGDGLIGKYPLLSEGTYRDDSGMSAAQIVVGAVEQGVFAYQSMVQSDCDGPMRGFFTFVPGSIEEPTGVPFDVDVAPFPLDRNPEYMYTL